MAKKPRQKSRSEMMAPGSGSLWLLVCLFFVLLSGLAVFLVWERVKLQKIGREIVALQQAKSQLEENLATLHGQAEELSSYARIYRIASEKFGFVELKPRVILVTDFAGERK